MKQFHVFAAGITLLFSLSLAGCNRADPEVLDIPKTETPDNQNTDNALYPYPSAPAPVVEQAYPGPGAAISPGETFEFPEPVAGTATIQGTLVPVDPMYMLPKGNDAIYLVSMPADGTVVGIPEFIVGEAPQAIVDELTGQFVFTNIPVGQYAVVVLTTNDIQAPARYIDKTELVIIRIGQEDLDKTIDLGSIQIP